VAIGSVVATVVFSGVLLWVRPGKSDVLYSRATLLIFMVCAIRLHDHRPGGRALRGRPPPSARARTSTGC